MQKYMVDIEPGKTFDNLEDAQAYLNQFIKKVEVGYLVTMEIGDRPSRYVWSPADVDDGGSVDCPNGTDDLYPLIWDAQIVRDELAKYAERRGLVNISFGIEEVVL